VVRNLKGPPIGGRPIVRGGLVRLNTTRASVVALKARDVTNVRVYAFARPSDVEVQEALVTSTAQIRPFEA
jgi:NADP-dependent 3-hydroxy acid dehydrogenase YdfG